MYVFKNKFCMSFLIGILIYRIFPQTKKIIIKVSHAILHVGVMAFAIAALIAAFDSHNKRDKPIPK
jgi:predicted membrane channel-forming protein YqfA (hemolysin III family)